MTRNYDLINNCLTNNIYHTMEKLVTIYTDGACSPNPGKGGWGATLQYKDVIKELQGNDPSTTNNRMELTAAIEALNALTESCNVQIFSDSKYLVDGITTWYPNWKRKGKTGYLNQDLWVRLDEASARHNIDWQWVKGHSGNPGNERVDAIAVRAIKSL